MKQVTLRSGAKGWQSPLRKVYSCFDEFEAYATIYGNHTRLGFTSPKTAWKANPVVQGGTDPKDYRRVRV